MMTPVECSALVSSPEPVSNDFMVERGWKKGSEDTDGVLIKTDVLSGSNHMHGRWPHSGSRRL